MTAMSPGRKPTLQNMTDEMLDRAIACAVTPEQLEDAKAEKLRRRIVNPEPWYVRKARLAQQQNPQAHDVQLAIPELLEVT